MTIKVYVAGSTRSAARARAFMDRVRALEGASVALDWIASVDAADGVGGVDSDLRDAVRAKYARADLDAVESCDVLVLLAEESTTGRGMWVELGFALSVRKHTHPSKPLIIVSGGGKRSIFTSPEGCVDFEHSFAIGSHDDDAFETLRHFVEDCDGVE